MRTPAGTSIFAAAADGQVIEIQRSERARLWRQELHRHMSDAQESEDSGEQGFPASKSLIIWGLH
jgi:MerR family transcriptional regulator/heat shock protein HspR